MEPRRKGTSAPCRRTLSRYDWSVQIGVRYGVWLVLPWTVSRASCNVEMGVPSRPEEDTAVSESHLIPRTAMVSSLQQRNPPALTGTSAVASLSQRPCPFRPVHEHRVGRLKVTRLEEKIQ